VVCAIPGEVEEGERRHHIMANHGDIQPALSTCLWQLCVAELLDVIRWYCDQTIAYGVKHPDSVVSTPLL